MRFHRNYAEFALWTDRDDFREFAHPDRLVAARLEPVIRQGLPHTTLDLVFRSGVRYVTVPAIVLDAPQLVLREADRLIWPAAFASAAQDEQAVAIEEFLFPWLRSITLARSLCDEHIRHFGSAEDRQAFEAARDARFIGASLWEDSVAALAPYVFGARYCAGKNVLVAGAADGVQGAVFLSRVARGVSVRDLNETHVQLARRWLPWPPKEAEFGLAQTAFFGTGNADKHAHSLARNAIQIRVDAQANAPEDQQLAAAVFPLDILFTNETLHGPSVREFAVLAPHVEAGNRPANVPAYTAAGGSSGRVLFGMRRGWDTARDSDVDSALQLAALLRAEGFTVDLTGEPTTCDYASYDVVHCFNLIEVPNAAAFLKNARRAGVRTVLTAAFLDVCAEKRQWGTETNPVCFRQEIDETSIKGYLSFVARRALLAPGWESDTRRGPIPNFDAMVAESLGLCDLVIAESAGEAALVAQMGFAGDMRVVPPFMKPAHAAVARPPVTFERFALVHAPVEPRNNQLFAVRAAREAGMPLVLAGHVNDMEYAARIREAGDEQTVLLNPDDSQTEWLYAHAESVVDYSWYAYGTQRLWRAVLSGARVCASSSGWGPSLFDAAVISVDPATPGSLAEAIAHGPAPDPDLRGRLARALEPGAMLRNVLAAYSGAAPVSAGA